MLTAEEELRALREFCHEEATAEHNAEDACAAFAIVRDRISARLEELRRERVAFDYEDWGRGN